MDVRFETKYGNKAGKHEWLTPKKIIDVLGPFDLDPCYSLPHPWETASSFFTEDDNGLLKEWYGFVWCNPPYGEYTEKWLKKLSEYKNGIALIFARTETKMFKKYIWEKANGIFFFYKRLCFYDSSGNKAKMSAGAPSCLVSWNEEGLKRLSRLNDGKLLLIK
jgi:hypothetical protein